MTAALRPTALPALHPDVAYRPEVDGLRSVAVLAVIFYHAGFAWAGGGYVGVDVFFVISGYLITSIIREDLLHERFTFARFYERRVRRIFPALFLVLACCLPAAWVWLTPAQLKDFGQSMVAVTFFLSNLYFQVKSGYFGETTETIPLIHTWSLSVEEQFYVVFPVLLLLLWRLGRRWITPAMVALAILSLAMCLRLEATDPNLNFFLSPTRAWELLAGALVAFHRADLTRGWLGSEAARQSLSAVGLGLVMYAVVHYTRSTPFPGRHAIAPVLGTALLLCYCQPATWVGRVLAWGPMVGVGLLSYSAYLWHQPLFAFARVVSPEAPSWTTFLALIALTFMLSYLSWRFVETPFRRSGSVARRNVVAAAVAASLVSLAIGLGAHFAQGLPGRYDEPRLTLAATRQPSPMRERCHTEGRNFRAPAQACRYLEDDATWAVLGDSHGVEVAYALAEAVQSRRQGVLHLTFSGCPPALSFDLPANPGCSQWTRQALAFLESNTQVRHVLIAYRHSFHLYGDQLLSLPGLPDAAPRFLQDRSKTEARAAYWQDLRTIVQRLRAAGKQVLLMDPVPELGAPIDRQIFRRDLWGRSIMQSGGLPQSYHEQRNGAILRELRAMTDADLAQRVPTREAVCKSQDCFAILDGQALYFDDNHLSMAGARRLVPLVFAAMPLASAAAASTVSDSAQGNRP